MSAWWLPQRAGVGWTSGELFGPPRPTPRGWWGGGLDPSVRLVEQRLHRGHSLLAGADMPGVPWLALPGEAVPRLGFPGPGQVAHPGTQLPVLVDAVEGATTRALNPPQPHDPNVGQP